MITCKLIYSMIGCLLMFGKPMEMLTRGQEKRKVTESCSTSQESDWIYFNSTCYFYSKDKRLRFTKAREYCRTFKNSELTSIYNKDENEFIRRRINELAEDYQYTWIGLAIDNTNKTYWYQNPLHSLAYINWLYPEKNRDSNLCTAMLPNGYWIEVDCFNEFSFICKKKAVEVMENANFRVVIITCLPAAMVLILMLAFLVMLQRSKRQMKVFYKRIEISKKLHEMLTSGKHQNSPQYIGPFQLPGTQKRQTHQNIHNSGKNPLAGRIKRISWNTNHLPPSNSNGNISGDVHSPSSNGDLHRPHNVNSSELQQLNAPIKGNLKLPSKLETQQPPVITVSSDFTADNKVFFIHDESKRKERNETFKTDHVMNGKLPLKETTSTPVLCYTQDIDLVLSDELTVPDGRRRASMSTMECSSSTDESYSRSSISDSIRNSISDSLSLSTMADNLRSVFMKPVGVEETSFDDSFSSYKEEITDDDFVEVSLCDAT